MNRTTIINIVILGLALVGFTWGGVAQNKVNANEEILNLQQEKYQLEKEIQEEKDGWWVDEEAKTECITSWEQHQEERTKNNDWRRNRIQEIEEKLGLLLQSQLQ